MGVIDLTIEYILDKLDEAINATYTLQKLPLFNIEYSVAIPYNVNHYNMKHYDEKLDEIYFQDSYATQDNIEPLPNKYDIYDNDNNIKFKQRNNQMNHISNLLKKSKIIRCLGKM